jgi:hypothetical protein
MKTGGRTGPTGFRVMGATWGVAQTGKHLHLWRCDDTGWSYVADLEDGSILDLIRVLNRYREVAVGGEEGLK